MTKVEQGILINSQHQYNVMNDIPEDVSFYDQITALGYDSIMQFFEEKAVYDMQSSLRGNLVSVHMSDLLPVVSNILAQGRSAIISIYTDETCVCHGENAEKLLNSEYCIEHDIPIYPYDSFGGNIVATEGDFGLAIIMPTVIDMSIDKILDNFRNILSNHFTDVTIDGNDILIDGKKVVGSGSFSEGNSFILLAYFSMSDKGELISTICGDPMTGKIPGHIDEQIVTAEDLHEEVTSWLQGL